jgi:hypothetical protein
MGLALTLRQPFLDVLQWEPEDVATALEWLDDRNDAIKDAQRGG